MSQTCYPFSISCSSAPLTEEILLLTVHSARWHWLSNKQCPSKFSAMFLKFLDTVIGSKNLARQTFLALSSQWSEYISPLWEHSFIISNVFWVHPSLNWLQSGLCQIIVCVWCIKLDDVNITLKTYQEIFWRKWVLTRYKYFSRFLAQIQVY